MTRKPIVVVIPTYGQTHLTHTLLTDIAAEDELVDAVIVDNIGDYTPHASERVLRPDRNLGWAGGCNHALTHPVTASADAVVLLNNDTHLSCGFFTGLLDAYASTGAALLGPLYDNGWEHQLAAAPGPADRYQPVQQHRAVPFLDGTCLFIPRTTLETVGHLNTVPWPRYGWGCDKDYALRVRLTGGQIVVTALAYLNHLGRQTADTLYPPDWVDDAHRENANGMTLRWGTAWKQHLYTGFPDLETRALIPYSQPAGLLP